MAEENLNLNGTQSFSQFKIDNHPKTELLVWEKEKRIDRHNLYEGDFVL
jgi:hypothetical protein